MAIAAVWASFKLRAAGIEEDIVGSARAPTPERQRALPLQAEDAQMTRYFFNVFAGSDSYDDEGTFLEGEDEAHIHMVEIARKLIKQPRKKKTWSIEALDEKGRLIGCLEFGSLRQTIVPGPRAKP